MISMLIPTIVLAALVVFAVLFVIVIYNKLVTLRNRFKNAYAQIDVQLKRRYDLIPNLVETAKGYIKHERETLEAVIAARNAASSARMRARANPAAIPVRCSSSPARRPAGRGAGPPICAVGGLPRSQSEYDNERSDGRTASTENKVSFARQAYNDAVMAYNTQREVFPSNIVAGMLNFSAAKSSSPWKSPNSAAPRVSFS